ncbi:hypothetical protein [Microlunatus speluncae]|uniref:hypothetical protein n=1 Tax=Microlunatus speluncae TaxID=2594267 RepID=UPI001266073C|nr:hypothetical protein [Microlunatus speluncae]
MIKRHTGIPLVGLIGLALLAVPRVVLHDLGLIHEGTFVNLLLVFAPPAVWVAVAVLARVPKPLLTLVIIGGCYGIFLALGHQLLWDVAWGDSPPVLGGAFADASPAASALLLRGGAVISSLVTGLVVGLLSGLVAWLVGRLTRPREAPEGPAR